MNTKNKKHSRHKSDDKAERDKKFLIVAGVSFFMTSIMVLWFFNIQTVFETKQVQGQAVGNKKLEELKSEFRSAWKNINEQVDKLKEKNFTSTTTPTTSPAQATTSESLVSSSSTATSSAELEELKKNIEKELQ